MNSNGFTRLTAFAIPALLALSGCGKSGNGSQDTGAPVAAPPPGAAAPQTWMEKDLQRTLKEQSNFYVFKTAADLAKDAAGLTWQDGSDLPEFANPDAKKGGTIRLWIPDFPRTFRSIGPDASDPFRTYLLDELELVFLKPHPNIPGRFYPEIAQSWAVDRANKTVYIRLDPAARWSDGVPFTMDDVVFTWYYYRSPQLNEPWYNDFFTKTYDHLTFYDARTFSITLRELKPDIEDRAGDVEPFPKHFFSDFGPGWTERYNWRVSPKLGPYTIRDEDIKKQVSVTLTRLKDWWAKDKRFLRGRFNPDRVRLVVIREPDKALEAFARGDLDIFPLARPNYWYDRMSDSQPDVAAGYIVKAKFFDRIPCPDIGLWINEAKPLLDNNNVRLGIQYATNFDLVCKEYYRGDAVRQQTRSDGYGWRVNPTIAARPFDPVKARAYFAKAGFTRQGPDGILVDAQGRRLSFAITAYSRAVQDILVILKQEALKAGLEFNLDVLDETTGIKKMDEKQHDITIASLNRSVEMFPRYWEMYAGVNAYDVPYLPDGSPNPARKLKPNTNNLTSTAIPELDRLITAYDKADSMDQVKDLASKIEQIIYDDASWVNGWKLPFFRLGYWRWVEWPADFVPMQSRDFEEFWTFSINEDAERETRDAKSSGRTFPRQSLVFDKYKEQ
jgi:microcin C transport system substrate-binding protein